jgi:thermostable 8-oxoguanine DNA glycosylase
MSQVVHGFSGAKSQRLELPDPEAELLPGIRWGSFDHLFTPAFWAAHAWQFSLAGQLPPHHRLCSSLRQEILACLLGGYGIPAEVGLAAFAHLSALGLLERSPTESELLSGLQQPLLVNGRITRYRFARQKANYLAATLRVLDHEDPPSGLSDVQFRNWLTRLPGVGLKTASWITRNVRDSDAVAIIDIHLFRAGRLAGIFPARARIERDYEDLERRFIGFASAIGVRASQLDALVWHFMKRVGRVGIEALAENDSDQITRGSGIGRAAPSPMLVKEN